MGTWAATLEKISHQEREHEKSDTRAKADDAKDQTCKGDAATTESATAGCDPPAGYEAHDRCRGTEQEPRDPEEKDLEDERQDAGDEGSVSKAVDTTIGIGDSRTPLLPTKRWRRQSLTHSTAEYSAI